MVKPQQDRDAADGATLAREVPASRRRPGDLRVAMIGFGMRRELARWLHRPNEGSRVVTVVDSDPAARQRVEEMLGTSTGFEEDYRALQSADLDAAVVLTPDDTHHAIARHLLRLQVPVYLEKPIALTAHDADDLLEVAFERGTPLFVGHNMRHSPVVRLMRDVIRQGEIGEVKAIWCRHFVGYGGDYYFRDWHADRSRTNSLLLQKGSHDLDVIHWLAGSYTREVVAMGGLTLYGEGSGRREHPQGLMEDWFSASAWPPKSLPTLNPTVDVEDISMVLMRLESGVFASYQQCHYTPDYWRNYTVVGTEGRLENFGDVGGGVVTLWNRRTRHSPRGDRTYTIPGDEEGHRDADELTVQEFLRFVRDGRPTETSPIAARQSVAVAAAATASLRDGSTLRQIEAIPRHLTAYFDNNQLHLGPDGSHRRVPSSGNN